MSDNKLPAKRNERGQFVKGVSGNPTGKSPRLYPDGNGNMVSEQELFRQYVPEVLDIVITNLRDPDIKGAVLHNLAKLVFDRGLGTAKQQIQHTVGPDMGDAVASQRMSLLSDELIAQLAEQMHKAEAYIDVTPDEE